MLASPLALADCTDPSGATVTCSNSVTTPQYFRTDGQSVTVAQGTQFTTTGSDTAIHFGSHKASLLNNGDITSDGDGIRFFSTNNSKVENKGTVTTSGTLANAINVAEVTDSEVLNTGKLTTTADGANGIYLNAVLRSSITNNGNITTSGANADGINANSFQSSLIANNGNITINGAGSNGIYAGSDVTDTTLQNLGNGVIYAPNGTGITVTENAAINTLLNAGIIDGGLAGVSLGGTSQTGTLVNTGTIIGGGSGNAVVLTDTAKVNQFENKGLIGALTGDAIQVASTSTIAGGINNQGIIIGRVNAPNSAMSNSGIFELLSSQQPSTVNTYVQNSNGVLALQADSTSSYGQLNVAGNASLNGRTVVITRGSTSFADGDELVDVVTASNITGSPSAVLDDSLRYQFIQVQTGSSYSLKIAETKLTTVNNAITNTSQNTSLVGVGTVVDNIINNNNTSSQNCTGALASTVCAITSSFNASQVHKNVVQLAP